MEAYENGFMEFKLGRVVGDIHSTITIRHKGKLKTFEVKVLAYCNQEINDLINENGWRIDIKSIKHRKKICKQEEWSWL